MAKRASFRPPPLLPHRLRVSGFPLRTVPIRVSGTAGLLRIFASAPVAVTVEVRHITRWRTVYEGAGTELARLILTPGAADYRITATGSAHGYVEVI